MNRRVGFASALVSLCAFAGCSADAKPEVLAIVDVTVVPMVGADILANQVVLIAGNRIVGLGPVESTDIPRGATRLSAQGGYLIPGLWDMHAHVFGGDQEAEVFAALLDHGVTGVRDMNGPVGLDSIQALKRAVHDGSMRGPNLFAPGPLVDAVGRDESELSPAIREVNDGATARLAVRELVEGHADFIKVYNRMTQPLLEAVFAEAAALGTPVVGHVPAPLRASALSAAGMSTQEHLQGILEESSDAGDEFRSFMASPEAANPTRAAIERFLELRSRMITEFDPARAVELLGQLAANGTAITPTLVSNRGVLRLDSDTVLTSDPRFTALAEEVQSGWLGPSGIYALISDDVKTAWFERLQSIVRMADSVGVPILAGTDLGVPWVYAGSSVHDELALLVDSGLSPLGALAAATSTPAQWLGLDDHGTVRVGNVADLVILGSDPTQDINAVRDVRHVIRRGELGGV